MISFLRYLSQVLEVSDTQLSLIVKVDYEEAATKRDVALVACK